MRLHVNTLTRGGEVGILLLALTSLVHGQVTVFSDTFDRPNNVDIDADAAGMSGIVAPVTYNEISDYILTDTGDLTKVEGNELYLAFGPNATVFHPDVNFVSNTTTSLSVSLDLIRNGGTAEEVNQRWVGIGFGATRAEAESAVYDFNSSISSPSWKGNQSGTMANSGFADLFVAWERTPSTADNLGQIVVYRNGVRGTIFNNGGSFYSIGSALDIDLSFANFNAGTPVSANISYNGSLLGTEAFNWDSTNANYIGITARQNSAGWTVDNLVIEANAFDYIPAQPPTLVINRDTGNITLTNLSDSPITLAGYTIQTTRGAFDTNNWMRIGDLGADDVWEQLTSSINPSTDLSEATLGAGLLIDAVGGDNDSIDFGNVWTKSPHEDLEIEFRDSTGAILPIEILYEGNGGEPFMLGDFDFDNDIDGRDFLVWQRGVGTHSDAIDLADWQAAYGMGAISAAIAVPEPSSWWVTSAGVVATLLTGRRATLSSFPNGLPAIAV